MRTARARILFSVIVSVLLAGVWLAFAGEGQATFGSREFEDVHDSMLNQKKNLLAIQSGFLMNDTDAIQSAANALAKNILAVSRTLPEEAAEDSGAWMAMYQIAAEAQSMQDSVAARDFAGAYEHYTALAGQCVACHQGTITRLAGPPLAVKPPEPTLTDNEQDQNVL